MTLIYKTVWIIVTKSWKGNLDATQLTSEQEAIALYNEWINMITGYEIFKPEKIVFVSPMKKV